MQLVAKSLQLFPYLAPVLKKLAVILLFGCLFIQAGGYLFLYLARLTEIRNEMHDYVRSDAAAPFLTTLHLHKNILNDESSGFKWHDDQEEFEFNNEMFDVVALKQFGDSTIITCVRDRDEEQLQQQMLVIHRSGNSKSGKSAPTILKFLSSLYTCQQSLNIDLDRHGWSRTLGVFQCEIPSRAMDVIAPPPRPLQVNS